MKRVSKLLKVAALASGLSCGGAAPQPGQAAGPPGADAGSGPGLRIVAPAQNDRVRLGTDEERTVVVQFELRGFELAYPGSCGTRTTCGHVHASIDGVGACHSNGWYANSMSWVGNRADVKFGICAGGPMEGPHTVILDLHDDNHQRLAGDSVSITTLP
jgi:hypothetical protein